MPENVDEEIRDALERGRLAWIQANANVVRQAEARSTAVMADAIGVKTEVLLETEVWKEIQADAKLKGQDVVVMLLRLGASSDAEFHRLHHRQQKNLSDAVAR